MIAVPSPALYTQFELDVSPGTILQALRNSGFDAAATLWWSCRAVTHAIDLFLAEYRGPGPLISSFCPSVVRLIQIKYPELVDQLLPVLSPREVAAREAKRQAASETGLPLDRVHAVYVTPCPAKMVSINSPATLDKFLPRRGDLDPGHLPPDPRRPPQKPGGRPHAPPLPGDAVQRHRHGLVPLRRGDAGPQEPQGPGRLGRPGHHARPGADRVRAAPGHRLSRVHKISDIHGQATTVKGRLIVAVYHPAAALHQQSLRPTLEADFMRLPELISILTAKTDILNEPSDPSVPEPKKEARRLSLF